MLPTKRFVLLAIAGFAACSVSAKTAAELESLLGRMTLEEKIGQLVQTGTWFDELVGESAEPQSVDACGVPLIKGVVDRLRRGEIGSLIGVCGIDKFNAYQAVAVRESRLGIPLMVGGDLIHGANTEVPIPLGLSCAWDEDLWCRTGRLIAREAAFFGCNWTFAPMVDISRDARWGRSAESCGADQLLASKMSAALVRGIQETNGVLRVAACLKHFVGYGAGIAGRDYNAVEMSESTLRNVYLPPFKSGLEAGALTVMPAFHSFNGVPCTVNRKLLTDILRGELGFRGFTISDWHAIGECAEEDRHGIVEDGPSAAAMALAAGTDQDMLSGVYRRFAREAVKTGLLPEGRLDETVRRILFVKNELGLFEHPYIDKEKAIAGADFPAGRALAREAAACSCVLLKNDGVLPLRSGAKIALVGPGADDLSHIKGCWSFRCGNVENALLTEGLAADGVEFTAGKGYGFEDEPVDEAVLVAAAQGADVVVAVFGEHASATGENQSRMNLELGSSQLRALEILKAQGRPVVALLMNGRPLVVNALAEKANAVLETWHPGTSGGWGIADVLTGRVNPAGRLTTEFPRATGQCPLFYDRTRTGRPDDFSGEKWPTRYRDGRNDALYPFGYGLSYTTFAYTNETVSVVGDMLVFGADVVNCGTCAGVETVQAYVHQLVAEEVPPRRRLCGWTRVAIPAGETRSVKLRVPVVSLRHWAGSRLVSPQGRLHAWVAPDSASGKRLTVVLP